MEASFIRNSLHALAQECGILRTTFECMAPTTNDRLGTYSFPCVVQSQDEDIDLRLGKEISNQPGDKRELPRQKRLGVGTEARRGEKPGEAER